MSDEKDILRGFDNWEECAKYYREQWDEAHHEIEQLVKVKNHFKDQYKEACYVIGKMSIENTNLKEENNRLAVVVSAQEKEIKEFEEQIDNECDHCQGSGYDPYPNHDTTMRPCPKCGGV